MPVTGFASITSAFGTHLADPSSAGRGGDLMILYPNGTLRNLTREAGFGVDGLQTGNNSIAVRQPCVHWSGTKAIFSMVVGAPVQYATTEYFWQMYEVTGLTQGEAAVITKVPNQPASYNNISPIYATDDQIIFTSDRMRTGERHFYPQRDEYESTPTVTGLWKLDPASGQLQLLNHTPSGVFHPSIDSFGRLIFIRWDHLQQDQQADARRGGNPGDGFDAFTWSNESAAATNIGLTNEIFPEPRLDSHPANVALRRSGLRFNLFMPWQMNQDGTEEETLNHVGRQELTAGFFQRSFLDDPALSDDVNQSNFINRAFMTGGDGGMLALREDLTVPGTYYTVSGPEFSTNNAGQLMKFTGGTNLQPEQMVMTHLSNPLTRAGSDATTAPAGHSGFYRNPLPLTNGRLIVSHTSAWQRDSNLGTRARPQLRHDFRLKTLRTEGNYLVGDQPLTAGIRRTITFYDPDVLVTYDGLMWEIDPVEVFVRPRPVARVSAMEQPERDVFVEEGVNENDFRAWLIARQLALIVTRNNTSRDRSDRTQPFNLRVPGGVTTTGTTGKIYDISSLQIVQADLIRGYGNRPGRRVIGQFMHDPAAQNPANPTGPAGSVKVGADGSSAALVPARRALSWQLTDAAGAPVVRERNWLTFQPGEIRTCAACHGVNSRSQANLSTPMNKPEALRELLRYWKGLPK